MWIDELNFLEVKLKNKILILFRFIFMLLHDAVSTAMLYTIEQDRKIDLMSRYNFIRKHLLPSSRHHQNSPGELEGKQRTTSIILSGHSGGIFRQSTSETKLDHDIILILTMMKYKLNISTETSTKFINMNTLLKLCKCLL